MPQGECTASEIASSSLAETGQSAQCNHVVPVMVKVVAEMTEIHLNGSRTDEANDKRTHTLSSSLADTGQSAQCNHVVPVMVKVVAQMTETYLNGSRIDEADDKGSHIL